MTTLQTFYTSNLTVNVDSSELVPLSLNLASSSLNIFSMAQLRSKNANSKYRSYQRATVEHPKVYVTRSSYALVEKRQVLEYTHFGRQEAITKNILAKSQKYHIPEHFLQYKQQLKSAN